MKKMVGLSTLGAELAGILSLQLADTTASIADIQITSNQITSGASGAEDSYTMEVAHPDFGDCLLFA